MKLVSSGILACCIQEHTLTILFSYTGAATTILIIRSRFPFSSVPRNWMERTRKLLTSKIACVILGCARTISLVKNACYLLLLLTLSLQGRLRL